MENYITIDSVGTYFKLRNYELLHPLIGILNFDNFKPEPNAVPEHNGFNFACYAIFLKDNKSCKMKYGGKSYDYDDGTMVFIAPQQSIGFSYDKNYVPKGYALLFHPDLLLGTDFGKKINSYSFFSYAVNEALHLSSKERKLVLGVLKNIQFELEQNLDEHSKQLIASNLELLLNYCSRFYDRQFLTRQTTHNNVLIKFDVLLSAYLTSDQPQRLGLPSVSHFANQLHFHYLSELCKLLQGLSLAN